MKTSERNNENHVKIIENSGTINENKWKLNENQVLLTIRRPVFVEMGHNCLVTSPERDGWFSKWQVHLWVPRAYILIQTAICIDVFDTNHVHVLHIKRYHSQQNVDGVRTARPGCEAWKMKICRAWSWAHPARTLANAKFLAVFG